MAGKIFWENQFSQMREGKEPALTIDQEQERDKPQLQLQEASTPAKQDLSSLDKQSDSPGITDYVKASAAGVIENIQSKAEILRLDNLFLTEHPTLGTLDLVPEVRKFVSEKQLGAKESIADFKTSIEKSMSESAQAKLEKEFINENLEFTDNAKQLSSWTIKATKIISQMIPDLVLGGMTGKRLYAPVYETAYKAGVAKGLTDAGAKVAANKIANAAVSIPTAALATSTATGGAGVQAREAIESLPWADLQKSEVFVNNFKAVDADPANESMSDQQKLNLARTLTAEHASSKIMQDPKLLTVNALASFIGDATLGRMIAGKMGGGIINKAVTGFAAEAPTEAAQSAAEQYAQNLILIDVAGQDIDPMKGVVRAAAEGWLLGGALGGTVGGTVGTVEKVSGKEQAPLATEPAPTVAERRAALEEKLAAQQEQARQEKVLAGTGEVQEALAKGETAPTPIELIAQAKEQAKIQKDEFAEGRAAPTVAERRANLERRLAQQSAEYAKQQTEAGKGPVQERLSMPTSPTVDELLIKAPTEAGPSPFELEYRKQAERDYIEKVKDAAIPAGLKGKPNAIKLLNKGYRNAITDFGGLSEQLSKSTAPEPKTDTMAEVIGKMGGIGRTTAEAEGFDPAMFKGSKTFSTPGKMTFDDAAEKLNELGYRNRQGDTLDSNDVVDMLYGEVNNTESHYSTQVDPKMLTADAQMVRSWAKALGGADKLNSTIKRSLAGERLGKRQAEVMEDMLDAVAAMRSEGAGQAKQVLDARRAEREAKRIESFNTLMADATGNKSHIADIESYNKMLSEKPEHYSEEQVILDELVATAGDIDFNATSEAIDLYESGKTSLPNLLTKLSDISNKRERTYAEAKPAIQAVSKPTAQPVERVATERTTTSEGAPAAEAAAELEVKTEKPAEAESEAEAVTAPMPEAEAKSSQEYSFDDISRIREGMGSLALQELGGSMAAKKARDIAGRIWAGMAGGKTYSELADKERSDNFIGMKMFEDAAKKVSLEIDAAKASDKKTAEETKPEAVKELPAAEVEPIEFKNKSHADWDSLSKKAIEGDLTPSEYVAGAEQLSADKERLMSEISKAYTKPKLLEKLGPMAAARAKSEKKDVAVSYYYQQLLSRFHIAETLSYGMGKNAYENAVIESAKKITPESIEAYKEDLAKKRGEYKTKFEGMVKSVKNPETLDEFKQFVNLRGEDKLTTEQKVRYEALLTEAGLSKRVESKMAKAVKKGLGADVEVVETSTGTHGKTGEPIINVKLGRLGADQFKQAAAQARSMGGGYWRGNFYLPDQKSADEFTSWIKGGDIDRTEQLTKGEEVKQKVKVTKLISMAEKLEQKANEDLSSTRRENTARQMRMADSSRAKADSDASFAKMLRAVANGIESGEIKYLAELSSKAQLETLDKKMNGLRYNVPQSKIDELMDRDRNSNLSWKSSVSIEDRVQFSRFPMIDSHYSAIERWSSEMDNMSGYKQAAASLKKTIAGLGQRDYATLDPSKPYFNKLLDFLKDQPNYYNGTELAAEYSRLTRMGIDTPAALRTALIELNSIKSSIDAPKQKTTVEVMERELKRKMRLNRNAFNDFFPTPKTISDDVVSLAGIGEGMKVLEPSAGNGELADAMNKFGADIDVVEMAGDLRAILQEKGYNLVGDDFMEFKSGPVYDRIVMNPPFSNDQDIDHVYHAYDMLKAGGKLVAIVSSMAGDRSNNKNKAFKEWVSSLDGQEELLPENAFLESLNPTAVRTKTILVEKPEEVSDSVSKEPSSEIIKFSSDSIVAGTPKGMPAKQVDVIAKSFIKEYKGAAGIKAMVFQTQKEAMDYAGIQDDESVLRHAFYNPRTNEVVLISNNIDSAADARKILRHEVLAHHGLMRVVGQDEWRNVVNLVSASRNAKSLESIWSDIDERYEGFDENAKAEEVIASIAELEPSKLGEWGNRIIAAITRALRKVGFVGDKITATEIKDMIRIIGERIKTVSAGRSEIKNDIKFSNQLTAKDGFSIPDETRKDAFLRSIQDKYRRLKVTQKAVKEQGGMIDESKDVYLAEELFHGKVGEDLRVMEDQYIKPLVEYMGKENVSREELDLYLIARHAPERNAQIAKINPDIQDGGSGMTDAEAAKIMDNFTKEGTMTKVKAAAAFVDGIINSTKQRLIDSGLESQDIVDSWDSAYKHYVPLKGFAVNESDTEGNRVKATGKGFSVHGRETMRAMGRRTVSESPLAYVISDATQSAIRARKNEVAQTMLRLVDANPDPELWQVFSSENPDTTRKITKRKDPATGKTVETVIETVMPMHAMKDKYLGAKMGGEQYYIKLHDPRLMEAMANLGVEQANILTKTIGRVTRVLSALITSYDPQFALSNFARDVQTAVYNVLAESKIEGGKALGTKDLAKEMVKDIPSSMKALKRGFRDNDFTGEWGAYLKEYLDAGAKTGWFVQKDIDEIKDDITRSISTTGEGAKNKLIRSKDKMLKFIDDYNDVIENSSRLSVYTNARRLGLTEKAAASLAKNLTVNFNRRGEMTNSINALYMFFNASVQGTANMLRAVMTPADKTKKIWDPEFYNLTQKIAMALPIATILMAQANREWGGDDDDGKPFYDKVPDYVKETNFVLMIPGSEGDFIKIPMPYGYNFFASIGNAIDRSMNTESTAIESAFDTVAAFAGAFSPLGAVSSEQMTSQVVKTAAPAVLKPFVEMALNENFTGSPIYKEQNPFGLKTPDAYNSQRKTWEWAKGLSEYLNDLTGGNQFKSGVVDIAPESWQHLIKFAGGGLGSLFGRSQDLAVKTVKGESVESGEIPFWRKYMGSISESVDISEMYKRFDEIKTVEKQATMLPGEERIKFITENRPKVKLISMTKGIQKELTRLNKQKAAIDASKLSDEQKQTRIDAIEERKRLMAARFNKAYNEAVSVK